MNFENRAISISLVILATISVFYVLVVGQAFLVPLAVAIMVWYVINALSGFYARIIPRITDKNWVTTLAALITIVLFISFAVDMVQNNITDVKDKIPEYTANFNQLSSNVLNLTGLSDKMPNLGNLIEGLKITPLISSLAGTFISMISNITLVLIYVLFLMLEQGTFTKKISALFPDKQRREAVLSILNHTQADIQTYLGIKTMTSAITGLVSYFILLTMGVDFAGFWAFTIFLLNYIPTVGSIVATFFPAVLALVQFDTMFESVVILLAVGSVQLAVGNILEPKLMGNSLNVSPFVVMISLTLWGSIWGIAGMFLSVPITVIMLIVFAHFEHTRYLAVLLSGDGSLKFAENQTLGAHLDD